MSESKSNSSNLLIFCGDIFFSFVDKNQSRYNFNIKLRNKRTFKEWEINLTYDKLKEIHLITKPYNDQTKDSFPLFKQWYQWDFFSCPSDLDLERFQLVSYSFISYFLSFSLSLFYF